MLNGLQGRLAGNAFPLGLKPPVHPSAIAARLKSCPDAVAGRIRAVAEGIQRFVEMNRDGPVRGPLWFSSRPLDGIAAAHRSIIC